MKHTRQLAAALLTLCLATAPAAGQKGEGKGKGQGSGGKAAPAQQASKQQSAKPDKGRGNDRAEKSQGKAKGQDKGAAVARGNRGNDDVKPGKAAKAERGASSSFARGKSAKKLSKYEVRGYEDRLPQNFRSISRSGRATDRFVVGAATYALARGLAPDALALRVIDDRLEVRNRGGDVLFDMNEDRARRLGVWNLRSVGDRPVKDGAPSFCRSGAGHPVHGREWCLDKGFGLGRSNDRLWARSRVEDIIFGRRIERDRLDRGSLIDVLGDVVFGRLALHALTLGFDQPLTGYYVAQPNAPRLMYINSGDEPVAELVDLNGDNQVDLLYVSHY